MKDAVLKFLCLLSLCTLLFTCKTPKELLQKGEYEKVLNSLDSRAKIGKLSASEKDLFVKSLNGYLNTGKKKLESRFHSPEPNAWKEGVDLLDTYASKQEEYLAYRQILDKEVTEVDVDRWYVAFGEKLFAYHLNRYKAYLSDFESSGEQEDVKKAYYEVQDMMRYDDGTLNLDSMANECLALGHRSYKVEIINRSFENFNYSYFENDINLRNTDWASFTDSNSSEFQLVIALQEVGTYENIQSEGQRVYAEQVIVGYNTVTDTLGTREEPIYENVQAIVREVRYAYIVDAIAQVWVFQGAHDEPIYDRIFSRNGQDEVVQNYFLSGDTRALPSNIQLDNSNPQRYNFDFLMRDVLRDLADEVSFSVQRM